MSGKASTQPILRLSFQTANLPLMQLCRLTEVLTTVQTVLSGCQEWVVFSSGDQREPYTPAGYIIDDLRTLIGYEVDRIREQAKGQVPIDRGEASAKFELLAMPHIDGIPASPLEAIRQLAAVAADIEWEMQRAAT